MGAITSKTISLEGGLDLKTPNHKVPSGRLIQALNVEQKVNGGYARMLGYSEFDEDAVPGEGNVLGVWRYNDKVYAFRNASGGATAVMYESVGSGWTSKKTGLAPDGNYEFVNYNFAGVTKMYGAGGTHAAFEWDGTTWTDVATGMSPDTPEHVIAHKKHLFLSFAHSVQFSPIGDPTGTWTPLTGAGEIAVEGGVTGFMQQSGGALAVFGRNSTNILQGSSSLDWTNTALSEYGNRIGAVGGSIQQLGSRTTYLDDRGLTNLYTSDTFGDFADSTISYSVNDILLPQKDSVTTSCVVKDKSQYRIFFSNGEGMAFTITGDSVAGITQFSWPDVVRCTAATEDDNGDEVIYFGSDNGFVYQMESGNSFSGANINANLRTVYTHLGNPRIRKKFKRANLDVFTGGLVNLRYKADYQFESTGTNPPVDSQTLTISGAGSLLGIGVLGSFILGSSEAIKGNIDIPGHGVYVSLFFSSDFQEPLWELDGITYDYSSARRRR